MTSLYALNYDCPIPWPAHPAYPASSSSRFSKNKGKQRQQEPGQEPLEQMEEVKVDMNEEQHHCECQNTAVSTLRTAYLHALYTCQRDDCAKQFLHTLTAHDTPWSRNTEGEPATLQQLQDLLLDLDGLDTKWHTTYSDLLSTWEEPKLPDAQEDKQPEEQALSTEASSSILSGSVRTYDDAIKDDARDQILQDQIAGTDPQDRLFKQAYHAWRVVLEKARNSTNGTSLHEHTGRKSKKQDVAKTSREWLSNLEVLEIKLQIVLSLEILARLPTPSSRLGPNRPTSSSRNSWFTDLRNSQISNNSSSGMGSTTRKRKKADSGDVRTSNMHQDSNHTVGLNNISQTDMKALEKLYKKIAIRLDQLTDNLAIHQAVSGLGFSLDDLVMDSTLNGTMGSEDAAGGEQDGIQDFWTGTVEPEYTARLPSDIISGCHSKFFSTSTSHNRPSADSQQEDSPYHHPTPNLKALAKSVAAAQAADIAKKAPASPTLAKLLKANDHKQSSRRRENEDEEEAEANWLLPPSATKAKSTYSVFLNKESQAEQGKRKLKRSQSLNVHQHHEVISSAPGSRNVFKSREVSFGQKKPGSSTVTATAASTANGTSTNLAGIRKTSAFMRTTSVPLLQASVNITTSSLSATTSSISMSLEGSRENPEASAKHNDSFPNHKRKPASPKRLSTTMQREKSRTLVLATPGKLHKHGRSRLSLQAIAGDDDDDDDEEGNKPGQMNGIQAMQSLVEEEEEDESPDEMDMIAHKRNNSSHARTLVGETPRTERILAAETPGSREIWVGETPGR